MAQALKEEIESLQQEIADELALGGEPTPFQMELYRLTGITPAEQQEMTLQVWWRQDWCSGYVYDAGGTRCSCGLVSLLQRARDALGGTTLVAPPAEGETEPATELQVPIQVDSRPRCNAPHPDGSTVACDKPRGHDGSHGVYYGWTGRAEVWS